MKRLKSNLATASLLFAIVLLVGVSCTVQKRVHRKGWYVEWNGSKHSNGKTTNQTNSIQEESTSRIQSIGTSEKQLSTSVDYSSDRFIAIDTIKQKTMPITLEDSKHINIPESERIISVGDVVDLAKDESSDENKVKESGLRSNKSAHPPRVPTLAWALLIAGLLLLAIGILAALIFAIINLTFIGLPFGYTLALVSGIIILILATGVAFSNTRSQPSPSDPRYVKKEPKREKKEREPLAKNDKISLAIIGGVLAGILVAILAF